MALRKNKTEILDKIITKAELIDYDYYWSYWDDDYMEHSRPTLADILDIKK